MLPDVPGYQLAAHNRPARQCGGDYYDAIALATDDRVLLCVADVSGKGLPAALVMSNMQATLRALLGRAASLPALAEESSALLFASTAPEKYVTAALAVLSPATGDLRFVGAGHVDTLILRASGEAETLSSTCMLFGLLPPGLPYGESHRSLAPGDTLVLFSDGGPRRRISATRNSVRRGCSKSCGVPARGSGRHHRPRDDGHRRVCCRGPAVRRHHAPGRPSRLTVSERTPRP